MIDRNILVCIENHCFECHSSILVVPGDCPYAILHPLELNTSRMQIKKWVDMQIQKQMQDKKDLGKMPR